MLLRCIIDQSLKQKRSYTVISSTVSIQFINKLCKPLLSALVLGSHVIVYFTEGFPCIKVKFEKH